MSQDVVSDALNMIRNAKKSRKEELEIKRISNLLIEVLKIMKQKGAIRKYKIDAKKKSVDVTIGNKMNKAADKITKQQNGKK